MKERFFTAFEEVLAANKGGEVKNLLITDGNPYFLDEALYQLRCWVLNRGYNLVELDEKDDSWLPLIQSRELFEKLNQPNTVLLIRNYATVLWGGGENTPCNFLRDAVMNRHYGCGNDFVPSDELPNLLFVVALNDLSLMYWREEEYSLFKVMHEKEYEKLWVNTRVCHPATQMHPVMSRVNKVVYQISADGKNLSFKVSDAFSGLPRRPLRRNSVYEEIMHLREEHIHLYLEKNRPDFSEQVENLILKGRFIREDDEYKLDAARLCAIFPNLKTVCCHDGIVIENAPHAFRVFDPFELGEDSFELAQAKDFKEANRYFRMLWALDSKWAKFWETIAKDFNRKPEDHPEFDPNGTMVHDGMDDLFRVYLLGWYSPFPIEEEEKIYVKKHKNFKKAIELLPIRFQNCDLHEVSEKLYWDLQYVETDENPDDNSFGKVLLTAESLYSDVLDQMYKDGWIKDDEEDRLREMMIKAEIEQILAELGIPDHIKAHAYLKEMILTAVHDPSAAIPYERLAKGDNVTKQFVHGAIRHAIDTYLKRNKGITVENLVETIGHRLHLKYYTRPVSENESK